MTSTAAGNLDASSTMNVVSANFKAYNMNFKNTYGAGTQAVAVTANGNQQSFYGVGFYGYQDTLYAKGGAQYYSNCYIEGAVDYIFGGAAAWFGECTIASNGGGAITANSRTTADSTWYVIDHSTVSFHLQGLIQARTCSEKPHLTGFQRLTHRLPRRLGLVWPARYTWEGHGVHSRVSCSRTRLSLM